MRKRLSCTSGEKGFILPFTLFILSIVFLFLAGSLQSYRTDLQITKSQTDQLTIESLFQMGRERFKEEDADFSSAPHPFNYSFPGGDVTITPSIGNGTIHLVFTVTLDDDGKAYTFTDSIQIDH